MEEERPLAFAFTLQAFAKINRSLRVLGRRPDGFHELDTVFQTIDLADDLTLTPADSFLFTCSDPTLPTGEENLVVRAAQLLAKELGQAPRGHVHLTKRIPHGAGLGGGSADAAIALYGFAELWHEDPLPEVLARLAARLGSDVPFFLHGGVARGQGRGERLTLYEDGERPWLSKGAEPWGSEAEGILLVVPPFPLSTPDVYRALNAAPLTERDAARNLSRPVGGPCEDPPDLSERNDLEEAAERLRPELRHLRELLEEAGALSARLSGSGSTVFGTFPDLETARTAALNLGGHPGMPRGTRLLPVATVSRALYRSRTRRSSRT